MKLNATLFLPWVNPYTILEKYRRGEYAHVTDIGVKEKITAKLSNVTAEKYGNDMNASRFHMKVNGGEIVVVVSSPCDRTKEVKCRRCNHVISGENTIPECIVIRRETHQKIEMVDGEMKAVNYQDFVTHRDPFCTFNCALGEIDDNPRRYGVGAEENTRYLCKCVYPTSGLLVKTPDPSYLDINGGTYTYEEYTANGRERHIPIGGLVTSAIRNFAVKM